MPIRIELTRAASGREFVRTQTSGNVGGDDVNGLITQLSATEYLGKSTLSIIDADAKFSPEARLAVRTMKVEPAKGQASAVVVKNTAQRIVVGFMLKVGNLINRHDGIRTKVFDNENDAVSWLEKMMAANT